MTGDAGRYRCPRCGEGFTLEDIVDHLEGQEGKSET